MTSDAVAALTTAYWDNFLNTSSSILRRDWERLDEVDRIFGAGGRPAIDMVLHLIETAPRDRDGWLSYRPRNPPTR